MADELTIEGKEYISSKRASKISGYAQDYIGQLARGGHIDAQRIGGLWYISMDSLMRHQGKASEAPTEPPQRPIPPPNADALITFEGRDYVSASRAADITGYHQDYVGQLARGGKISSRQVGNRWYVDREAIIAHKEEKDRLLGAVQAASVGISPVQPQKPKESESPTYSEPLMKYSSESSAPLSPYRDLGDNKPEIALKQPEIAEETVQDDAAEALPIEPEQVAIPIRRPVAPAPRPVQYPARGRQDSEGLPVKIPGKTMIYAKLSGLGLVALLAAFGGYLMLDAFSKGRDSFLVRKTANIADLVERFVSKELIYIRKN